MKNYYVYILKCSDSSFYVGVTSDIEIRLWEHENGAHIGSYTFFRRPIHLAYCGLFFDINHAIAFEKQIKGWSRKKKEALIVENWEKLKELATCKNITNYIHFKK